VNRVIPRDNETVNEVWISDRDRFSYQGLRSDDRITTPMVRDDHGELQACDWPTAIEAASDTLKSAGNELAVLASASLPIEELYLAQKMARALGSANIDHRLGQSDFTADAEAPVMPWLGMQLNDLESLDGALLIGSNIRKDQPIAALRLRKSGLQGASINFINPKHFPLHFDAADNIATRYDNMVAELLGVCMAAGADVSNLSDAPPITAKDYHQRIASALKDGERSAVFLGNLAVQHPSYSQLMYLSVALAKATDATLSLLPERANTAGAWLAGVLPHREAGGKAAAKVGKNAAEMLNGGMKHFLLVGTEVEFDAANPAHATNALASADSVVAVSAFMSDSLRAHADVILPVATFAEAFGTYVNAAGAWQASSGAVPAPGDARPAWKVFRVLAESMQLDNFSYDSPEAVARELAAACSAIELNNIADSPKLTYSGDAGAALVRAGETPIYATDPLVRRSKPLQNTRDGKQAFAFMSEAELSNQSISDGDKVLVRQNGSAVTLAARADNDVPNGCVWVPTGLPETAELGELFGPIDVSKA